MRINRNKIQYLLIYFMMIVNQSCLYQYFLSGKYEQYIILVVLALLFIRKIRENKNIIIILGVFLIYVILARLASGSVGMLVWIMTTIPILIVVDAINVAQEVFLTRVVRTVVFFAGVSIIFYIIQMINPNILRKLFHSYATEFTTGSIKNGQYTYSNIRGYGLFLYSMRDYGNFITRNKGIFTEPGICQIVYNAALYIILFLRKDLQISDKKRNKYIIILVSALITVQSTTGYFVMVSFIITYILFNKDKLRDKKIVRRIVVFVIIVIVVDTIIRDEGSFLVSTVIKKIFSESGDLMIQDSGMYRVNAATVSFMQMIVHPLGIGYDQLNTVLSVSSQAGGGGGLFKFGAAMGIIPFISIIAMYAFPIFRTRELCMSNRVVLFMFCMICISAQSSVVYPFLLLFPIYFSKNIMVKDKRWENE